MRRATCGGRQVKKEIFSLTDLVPDVDLEGDIDWMRAERERRDEALPPDPA